MHGCRHTLGLFRMATEPESSGLQPLKNNHTKNENNSLAIPARPRTMERGAGAVETGPGLRSQSGRMSSDD